MIKLTRKLKALAVIDKNVSVGYEGAVYTDVRSALYKSKTVINNYIMGLGGKDITTQDIQTISQQLDKQRAPQWILGNQ